jgi:hypothetical protein
MNNDRIYSASEMKTVGIFEEDQNKRYDPNGSCSQLRADILQSIHHYNEKGIKGVSLFIHGGGNVILGDVSLSEFLKLINEEKLYYTYSRKYERWYIYSIE